ncbi:MAG: SHOCT domain-containing protein [Acidimicrobiales bacterium]
MNDSIGFWEGFLLLLIFVPLAILWFRTVIDIFDRDDLGGGAKALWLLLVFVLPLFGTLIYLMTRPVTDKDRRRAEEVDQALGQIRQEQRMAAGFSVADELVKLEGLRDKGSLTAEEFDRQRRLLLP